MKTILLVVLMAAAGLAQEHASSAAAASKAADSNHAAVTQNTTAALPKDAVEIEPNLYRYTDAHGKAWLARRTPFGLSTWEDKPEALPAPVVAADLTPPVKAVDLGDSVRFEKKSPFGNSTWTKKKSELTDEEKDWLSPPAKADSKTPQTKPTPSRQDPAEKR